MGPTASSDKSRAAPTVRALGDCAFVIGLTAEGGSAATRSAAAAAEILESRLEGVLEAQAAFSSVTIIYDPAAVEDWREIARRSAEIVSRAPAGQRRGRIVEIPVVYGGEGGPDLEAVARHAGCAPEEVIRLHSGAVYTASAVGFVPGFAYLEGLPSRLKAPRRATPRTRLPAGSVGIGGQFTGVYPYPVPGGWNIIGRSPMSLFDPARPAPCAIAVGDTVRFRGTTAQD